MNDALSGQPVLNPVTAAIFVAQFNAIFVALNLQLQNRERKPAAISVRFYCNLSPRFEMQLTKHGDFAGTQLLFTK